MPIRIKRERRKGWTAPDGAIYCGRPGKWGNPFKSAWQFDFALDLALKGDKLGRYEPRIAKHMIWIAHHVAELRDKDLMCWCDLNADCHVDSLLKHANHSEGTIMSGDEWIKDPEHGFTARGAAFSPDRRHRYTPWRRWSHFGPSERLIAYIGLNPSTADETKNDPTVTRCIKRAQAAGFDGMVMLNLFGYRATDPREMKDFPEPIGLHNDDAISAVAEIAEKIVCCWGTHGRFKARDESVLDLLQPCSQKLYCLGLTAHGQPKHPLRLRSDTPFTPYSRC